MINKRFSIIIALACSIWMFNTFGTYATSNEDAQAESSLSIDQMEDLKKANQQQIDDLQNQIDETKQKLEQSQNDEALQQEYQRILDNKIFLQQENISYIEEQILKLNEEIAQINDDIDFLEEEMSALELNIDTNMEQFKNRLRAMYISGNDSLASILIGSTDFFDVLCKMEFIARISSHDNALMETLKSQINDYEEDEELLLMNLESLEEKKASADERREEFNTILEELSNDYKESQSELDRINLELEALGGNLESLEQYQKEQEEEEKKIQQAIEEYYIQSSIAESESISESISVSESESVSVSESIVESISQSVANSIYESEEAAKTTTVKITEESDAVTVATDQIEDDLYITSGFFNWPVPSSHIITDYYGVRTWNSQGVHYGLDISGNYESGADIVSAESGTVILVSNTCTHNYPKTYSCGCGGGFGNYVIVDHGNGYATLYGHCSTIDVSVGQTVQRGEVIAHIGSTGYSTGYHLHFEVRINGERVDPLPYLS